MKVLIITSMYPRPDMNTHGVFVHRQAIELSNLGIDIRVICPMTKFSGSSSFFVNLKKIMCKRSTIMLDSVPVTYLPYLNLPHKLSAKLEVESHYRNLYKYIKSIRSSFNFDMIHAHRLFPTGYVAMRVAQEIGVPFVVTARGSDVHTHPQKNKGIAHYTRETIANGNQIIAVSKTLAKQIDAIGSPTHPVKVVYNGVDHKQFKSISDKLSLRRHLGLPLEGVGICSICSLTPNKGVMELLKAFEQIYSKNQNVWLAIIGDGPLRDRLEIWIKKRGLEMKVFLIGEVSHTEIVYWLNSVDIFALATYNEGLPNVVLEAMACSLPVVATSVGGIPEAVLDKSSAFLVKPRQVFSLIDALNELIEKPQLRQQMGKIGYGLVLKKFQWNKSAEALIDIYQQLMRNEVLNLQSTLSSQIINAT